MTERYPSSKRVLIAPDSFKGSLTAATAAAAMGGGWLSARPNDVVDVLPLADGGEGTIDALHSAAPDSVLIPVEAVTGPDGKPVHAHWLLLANGVAVVELAQSSGLPLMTTPDPMAATTRGLGEVLRSVFASSATEVWVGLGGSASTDGGIGALRALGARAVDSAGNEIREGGAGLLDLSTLDLSALIRPRLPVIALSDVTSPLLGPQGAAAVFGPQKGATPRQVEQLETGLAILARVLGVDPSVSGSGAAGGTGYGLHAALAAEIREGAEMIADATALAKRIAQADVVITGEGSFDRQSTAGKLVGNVLRRTADAGKPTGVIAGSIGEDPLTWSVALTQLAGSADAAMNEAPRWCTVAGALAAREFSPDE